jgi:ribosomal protein S18 acetylase RimI-like enzyme
MIDDVFVVERFRGRKIGEALMLRAKAIAMISGYRRIRWGVESDNHGAIRFYQRLGATLHTKGVCTWDLRDVE